MAEPNDNVESMIRLTMPTWPDSRRRSRGRSSTWRRGCRSMTSSENLGLAKLPMISHLFKSGASRNLAQSDCAVKCPHYFTHPM